MISVIDKISDIETKGISGDHEMYIRQIMKGFDKNYLYKDFDKDYKYILNKLSCTITQDNNGALRSIQEALDPSK